MDQGEHLFKFWCNAGSASQRLRRISAEALAHNEKPFALSFFPSGQGRMPKPLALVRNRSVEIAAFKKAQTGNHWIIRMFNATGQKQTTQLELPVFKKNRKLVFSPFEVRTLIRQRDLLQNHAEIRSTKLEILNNVE